jgi:putative hydrolase of the HAD superfamily
MNAHWPAGSIRAVFFDAVGTLLHLSPSAVRVYAEAGAKFGLPLPIDVIRDRFQEAFRQQNTEDSRNGWATSEERELRRWRDIVRFVFQDDVTELFSNLWRYFAQPNAWRLFPETGEVLVQLSQRKLILGLASNFDRRLHTVAVGFPELTPLQFRLISSEIGWRKPSPNFFVELVRAADCEAAAVLYVGDDPANDYAGATAAGLQALMLNGDGGIKSLRQLLDLV